MAETTQSEEKMSREDVAAYLRRVADQFDSGEDEIGVEVGNKTVSLRPQEQVNVDVEVVERSSKLRGDRETLDIELDWKP